MQENSQLTQRYKLIFFMIALCNNFIIFLMNVYETMKIRARIKRLLLLTAKGKIFPCMSFYFPAMVGASTSELISQEWSIKLRSLQCAAFSSQLSISSGL